MNPGDLSWEALRSLGDFVAYDRSLPDQVLERILDAEMVLTNKVRFDRELILGAPRLKYIGVTATGYDIVDGAAAKERGIVVSNVPSYSTDSVAQFTFSLLLELVQSVGVHSRSVRAGDWSRCPDFSYRLSPLIELSGKTLGIIGFGKIGQAVARIALAMNMRVIAHHKHPSRDRIEGVEFVDLETCFRESDVLSLHCPLNEQTRGLVNRSTLALMKSSAFLLNVSRGPLVQDADLADALDQDRLAGAGLDVLSQEPPPEDHPLIRTKNCIVTPHIAWASREARERLMKIMVENVRSYLEGCPANRVY